MTLDFGCRCATAASAARASRSGASENVTTTSGPSEAGSATPTSNAAAYRCTLDQPSGTSNVSAGSKPAGEATVPASSARSDLPSSSTCTVGDGGGVGEADGCVAPSPPDEPPHAVAISATARTWITRPGAACMSAEYRHT